jgi:hypothetical protein
MVTLMLAAQQAHLGLLVALLAVGLLIGVFGHIIRSRALILTGILLIGLVSAYFSFVLEPGSR